MVCPLRVSWYDPDGPYSSLRPSATVTNLPASNERSSASEIFRPIGAGEYEPFDSPPAPGFGAGANVACPAGGIGANCGWPYCGWLVATCCCAPGDPNWAGAGSLDVKLPMSVAQPLASDSMATAANVVNLRKPNNPTFSKHADLLVNKILHIVSGLPQE